MISPEQYIDWRKSSNIRNHYIMLREPVDRLLSGLVENTFQYYRGRPAVMPSDFESFPDEIYEIDRYHVSRYLPFLLGFVDNSYFVPVSSIDSFILSKFEVPVKTKNTTIQKIIATDSGENTNGLTMRQYFQKKIFENKLPDHIQQHINDELVAYQEIINKAHIIQ
jgi:hypothetical protein